MNTLYIATYNRTSEIFDTRRKAEAFAAEMNDNGDRHPFRTSIREIDFEEAFEICKKGRVSYFGKKWDGNNPNPETE